MNEPGDRSVALLAYEVDKLRESLFALQADLAQVETEFHATPWEVLREANEQLMVAAMRAEAIADTADQGLGTLAGDEPLDEQGAELEVGSHAGNMRDLREANQRLIVVALKSQQVEATALQAHGRHMAFLATVAHELRNPLMPLRLAAQMLDRARQDDAAHARLQATIAGQVAQMTRLIGDLLDGSRASTGNFRLERTRVDLCEVIQRAIETCMPGVDERNQIFERTLPARPVMVLADPVRMVQVFANLLENASKYTPPGGRIWLQVKQFDGSVSVTIADDGIGISAAALPHVFDLFVRDEHATRVDHGGLGIGLSVVRELVRAHEGTVVAASPGEGLGSQFVVKLPMPPTIGPSESAPS